LDEYTFLMPEIFKLARKYLRSQGMDQYGVYLDTISSILESNLNKILKEIGADPERTTTKDLYHLIDMVKSSILNWMTDSGIDLDFI
jgi:hypothetical protein